MALEHFMEPTCNNQPGQKDKLLGAMPDGELAKRLGRSRVSVQKRRLRLGIEYRATLRPEWGQEALALLGKLPDEELAKRMHCTVLQVINKRKWRDIPAAAYRQLSIL